jgi:mono/diheme cytochrome c family protein
MDAMGRSALAAVWVGACLLPITFPSAHAADARPGTPQVEFFEKKVRPVLADNCFSCHGPQKQKGRLRLDSRAALLSGGESGPAIVPGKPEASLLIKAVHYGDDSPQMPPKKKLAAEQLADLTRWVRDGAAWPEDMAVTRPPLPPASTFKITAKDREFWSFRPVADPPLPVVHDGAWPRTSLDYFVLARQEAAGLHPAPPADRRTLIRRASFDLLGLPPTPEEVENFANDPSPDAYEKLIDRLLASPHYGERWARHWLDVARYGEDQAHTFQARKYPHGFRYRDWLIQAFNQDMPYDRFALEQLAGDLLDGPGKPERLAALGFFALGPVYYGDPKKLDQLDDRIDTFARGFLGLTVACARCHDHKFDPISQKDYYALAGIFAGTEYAEVPIVPPAVVEEAKRKQTAAEKKRKAPLNVPVVHTLSEGKPVTLRVHVRGNPDNLGEEAPRRFLAILGGEGRPCTQGSGRLELARAVASPDNPLTARVIVNRVWQHHFGRGIVGTPSNFGSLGERPTHPELLDHLATRFVRSGWSLKWLHREVLRSAAYQQSSRADSYQTIDPGNRLLWRMNRRRLEVEPWRDAMLAVAGRLDGTIGGPSVDLSAGDNRRRTIYAAVSRHELHPLLRLFDFPDPNITSGERTVTTVPLQQLFVLNSEFMASTAKALAARLTGGPGPDDAARIRRAFLLLYGRSATEREVRLGLNFLAAGGKPGGPASGLTRWEQYAQVLLSANEFLYVD